MRTTLATEVSAAGVALHAGVPVWVSLGPATPGSGIRFRRIDRGNIEIPALWNSVCDTRLNTVIGAPDGTTVGVIEHVMAALAGVEIDDCVVSVDGPEPPALDGAAADYLSLIEQAGTISYDGLRQVCYVERPVRVVEGRGSAALVPAPRYAFAVEINFPVAALDTGRFTWTFSPVGFRRDIAPARTYGFLSDRDRLRSAGYARGSDLDNTLVFDGDRLMNADKQRFPDEFVRHKILDAVGDLKLAGCPIVGRFEGVRSGHALNNALLQALFADSTNYRMVST